MNAAAQTRPRVIEPGDHVVDLVRREVDSIRRSASGIADGGAAGGANKAAVQSAVHVLRTIERSYPALRSAEPALRPDGRAAMLALRSSVAMTAPVMRKAIQTVGADDPGTTDVPQGGGVGTGADTTATDASAVIPETFDQYDPATQSAAERFYNGNAAQAVNDAFDAIGADYKVQLDQCLAVGDAAGGAAAANNAANNLGVAAGVAVGAIIGGPLGAAIGAFVGGAVFAYVRGEVLRMLAVFEDWFNGLFT